MSELAIIGGSGLDRLEGLEITGAAPVSTPYGPTSAPVVRGRLAGAEVLFLARHGSGHTIPPHRINYRANIRALADLGAREVVAVAAVGGIAPALGPGAIAVPAQVIDYTWGREQTFWGEGAEVRHVDFTRPYAEPLRARLLAAAKAVGETVHDGGTYGATQGPRLESAAEIDRMARDGCDLVGMTGMPEAALARELGLAYACCALVVNAAAGRGPAEITMAAIEANLVEGMARVRRILARLAGGPGA